MAITKGTFTDYAGADGSSTTVDSSSFDSTGAGLLIVGVTWEGADTNLTLSDNKGNTWQTAVENDFVNQNQVRSGMCWCVPTSVGTGHIVTATYSAARTFRRICVLNVNGTFSADALNTSANNDGNGTAVDAGTLTTTAAAILVQAVGNNNSLTFTAGSGWTKDSAGTNRHFQSRIESTSGTFDPAGTLSGPYDWSSVAMAFKELVITISLVNPRIIYGTQTGIVITGSNYGSSQGSGTVKISPSDNVADGGAITQTVTAWADTSITFTAIRSSLGQGTLYLFVTDNGGKSNPSGYPVQFLDTPSLAWLRS